MVVLSTFFVKFNGTSISSTYRFGYLARFCEIYHCNLIFTKMFWELIMLFITWAWNNFSFLLISCGFNIFCLQSFNNFTSKQKIKGNHQTYADNDPNITFKTLHFLETTMVGGSDMHMYMYDITPLYEIRWLTINVHSLWAPWPCNLQHQTNYFIYTHTYNFSQAFNGALKGCVGGSDQSIFWDPYVLFVRPFNC